MFCPTGRRHQDKDLQSGILSSFYGRNTPIFGETNCACHCFKFLCCLDSHMPSSRVDLVCAGFLCVKAMVLHRGLWKHCKGLH